MPETDKPKPQFPTLEEFEKMSDREKLLFFVGLPRHQQKLLIGGATFKTSANPSMLQRVSELGDDEFQQAVEELLESPFLTKLEDGRYELAQTMKNFINVTLTKHWEKQKDSRN